jgi:hypothetical protein
MNITGGSVTIEDGVKSSVEYQPPRKVSVTLRFDTAPDGSDDAQAALDHASEMARRKVYEMLAQGPSDKDKRAAAALGTTANMAAAPVAEVKPAAKAGPRTKAEKAGEDKVTLVDPKQSDIEDFTSKPAVEEAKAAVVVEDDEFSAAPAEITDADLNKIAQNAVIRLNEAGVETPQVKIREIVATYNPDTTKAFQMKQIPQAQRADFKAKVEALKGK